MAEDQTLTIDTSPNTETIPSQLTPDEQESLEIGEKMAAEQDQLLAGKYKNAQELEKAYKELEAKLGEQDSEAETSTEEDEADPEMSVGASLITDASAEYAEKGDLTPETMAKFSEMSSADLVKAYMEIQANSPEQQVPVADLSDAEVNTIKNSVGGEQQYEALTNWASENLDSSVIESFDSLINSGNSGAIQLAVQGLKAQYENANGYEGRMLSGKAPKTSGDVFRSQAEVVAAMNDPKYDTDPAYRQDLIEKLDRSNINF